MAHPQDWLKVTSTGHYCAQGIGLGDLRPATAPGMLAGQIVLAPTSAMADRWTRRLPGPAVAMASGRMRVRARALSLGGREEERQ